MCLGYAIPPIHSQGDCRDRIILSNDRPEDSAYAEGVKHVEPDGTVLSLVEPAAPERERESVDEIWKVFCHIVYFFSSAELAAEWITGKKQDLIILPVEDGFRLGIMAFDDILKYV